MAEWGVFRLYRTHGKAGAPAETLLGEERRNCRQVGSLKCGRHRILLDFVGPPGITISVGLELDFGRIFPVLFSEQAGAGHGLCCAHDR